MQDFGPVLRTYHKLIACCLFASLCMVGITAGLYLKMTVPPIQSAQIYYVEAKQYLKQAHSVKDRPSLVKLYRDQSAYYLAQASTYVRGYDPENLQRALKNIADQSSVTLLVVNPPQKLNAGLLTLNDQIVSIDSPHSR